MSLTEITVAPGTNSSFDADNASFPHFHLNHTDVSGSLWNQTGNWTEGGAVVGHDSGLGLSTSVIVAISVGSTAFLLTLIFVTVFLVRKRLASNKNRAWEDNLTLSYIADSNIDLTKVCQMQLSHWSPHDFMKGLKAKSFVTSFGLNGKADNYDDMISLDNDSFLNSLDTHSFSVFSPDNNTRQYTYSYF